MYVPFQQTLGALQNFGSGLERLSVLDAAKKEAAAERGAKMAQLGTQRIQVENQGRLNALNANAAIEAKKADQAWRTIQAAEDKARTDIAGRHLALAETEQNRRNTEFDFQNRKGTPAGFLQEAWTKQGVPAAEQQVRLARARTKLPGEMGNLYDLETTYGQAQKFLYEVLPELTTKLELANIAAGNRGSATGRIVAKETRAFGMSQAKEATDNSLDPNSQAGQYKILLGRKNGISYMVETKPGLVKVDDGTGNFVTREALPNEKVPPRYVWSYDEYDPDTKLSVAKASKFDTLLKAYPQLNDAPLEAVDAALNEYYTGGQRLNDSALASAIVNKYQPAQATAPSTAPGTKTQKVAEKPPAQGMNLDLFNKGGGQIFTVPLSTLKNVATYGTRKTIGSSAGMNPFNYIKNP